MLINAFPGGNVSNKRVELCRFTASGTFNPADHPTADGLYDVYIVGGGGGGYGLTYNGSASGRACFSGGGGGYAKLLSNISIASSVSVIIGAAGTDGNGYDDQDATDGGITKFGKNEVSGGKHGNYGAGGNGGCGGAGYNGSFGGVNGADGTAGQTPARYSGSSVVAGSAGKGGGTIDYCPRNPYDGQYYGVGGGSLASVRDGNINDLQDSSIINFPPINYNPGRGSGATAKALPGICIVYGIPKY